MQESDQWVARFSLSLSTGYGGEGWGEGRLCDENFF